MTTRDVCYSSVECSFREQRSINIACMELSSVRNRFFSVIGNRTPGFGRRRYGWLSLATARLFVLKLFQSETANFAAGDQAFEL